jgi:6-phosphofructokinase 1
MGIEEGFDGLIRGEMRLLRPRDVGGVLQRGGTFLRTARCPEFKQAKIQLKARRELNESEIDGLIVVGGDGSLRGAQALSKQGVLVVGAPSSIDNDIWGTDMSIGVDTALNTTMEAVDKLRDTASSHQRVFLVETMGHACGYLALHAGIICGAEEILLPEREVNLEEVVTEIEDAYARGKSHALIIAAEGASVKVRDLAKYLDERDIGFETRVTILGHVVRGGSPTAFDRMLGSRMGFRAVELLLEGKGGVMVGLQGRSIVDVPLEDVTSRSHEPNLAFYDMARMLSR